MNLYCKNSLYIDNGISNQFIYFLTSIIITRIVSLVEMTEEIDYM